MKFWKLVTAQGRNLAKKVLLGGLGARVNIFRTGKFFKFSFEIFYRDRKSLIKQLKNFEQPKKILATPLEQGGRNRSLMTSKINVDFSITSPNKKKDKKTRS